MPQSRKDAREAKRKARRKAKAEKAYAKAYGADSSSSASGNPQRSADSSGAGAGSEAGPRAALYKGKMGSSQKRSSKMQSKAAKGPSSQSIGKPSKSGRGAPAASGESSIMGKVASASASIPKVAISGKGSVAIKRFAKPLVVLGVIALFAVALYGPAQQYYVQMRETDRLEAEYSAVSQRNDSLQSEIDSLKTDEGVEDRAHEDLGYVMEGDETATVKGIEIDDDSEEFSSNVANGSVPAPETWYSPVLDMLFGYEG